MLIKTLGLLCCSVATVFTQVFAPSEGLVNRTEKPYREEICLNGSWEFQAVNGPQMTMPVEGGWDDVRIKIPSPWNVNDFAYRDLEGPDHRNYPSYPKEWDKVRMAWMRRTVEVPQNWDGKRMELYFEAVAGKSEVYVNGTKVGENFDLFLPFSLDVTDVVKPGETAEILVGVCAQSVFEDRSTIGRRIVPAGSMWGYHIAGIWQDVYLLALPQVHVDDVYVKPLVDKGVLELELAISNDTDRKADVKIGGTVREWLNRAGTDVLSAPVPAWELGAEALEVPQTRVEVPAGETVRTTISIPVSAGTLKYWTPEYPNLYSVILDVTKGKTVVDRKYERFGWRQWTLNGTQHCLNGEPYPLKGDSWHFMGIPQMTRRYAWAWFKAIKDMNGNAVRPHAQIYPRFYLDMADEMGICVLDETANWASDGGPKLDSELFWEASKDHLRRFVLRDRNHASVFGWSVSNENKPVILYVYNRPDLMPFQLKAWEEWRDIVRELDPTRPWISADGEDDGNGILPVTVGHYGDANSMKHWKEIGKPWGIGEHSMAYYGTPEQVSVYNGERAYESQQGRMEGLANECYHLLASQRNEGASYSTVFNMAWYGLKPLPLGKKDVTVKPTLEDGIFFGEYVEGLPGVQPERMGPYCTTFNPGYDSSLPLYDSWPMFDAMRAANAPGGPAWSPWAEIDKAQYLAPEALPAAPYAEVIFIGNEGSAFRSVLANQGVRLTDKVRKPAEAIALVDGSQTLSAEDSSRLQEYVSKGMDVWIWGITPATVRSFNEILPYELCVGELRRASYLPEQKSWMRGLNNSDFYFCEIQRQDASVYSLSGDFVDEGEVLLDACRTDWRAWNKRAEKLKTAAVLRSENECTAPTPVFVRGRKGDSDIYVSTLTDFAGTSKGYMTLSAILDHAGIPCDRTSIDPNALFFMQDGRLMFPRSIREKAADGKLVLYVYSPRPLDDLLIEPNMPKLSLIIGNVTCSLKINGKAFAPAGDSERGTVYHELPLAQGWNKLEFTAEAVHGDRVRAFFECGNRPEFLSLLQVKFDHDMK